MHSITDPSKVRFSGPLAPFAYGLTEEFAGLGYTPTSAAIQLQLAAHLSRWLAGAGLGPADRRRCGVTWPTILTHASWLSPVPVTPSRLGETSTTRRSDSAVSLCSSRGWKRAAPWS
jgi:hypothetical protein